MGAAVRVCFVGDSFVAGVGDETHRGWVGRLVARGIEHGYALTGYNLGVRGDTSTTIRSRFDAECAARLPPGDDALGVVFSFGVNDVIQRDGQPRVAVERRTANVAEILRATRARGWPVLMIGSPPVADDRINAQLQVLNAQMQQYCAGAAIEYVSVYGTLVGNQLWRGEVAADDGAHPRSAGYELLAQLIGEGWDSWLAHITGTAGAMDAAPAEHLRRSVPPDTAVRES